MLLFKIYSAWTENMTKSDQCPPCKLFIHASTFSSLQNGNVIANKHFDNLQTISRTHESHILMSWLIVSKATVDPRTKQISCLQYKWLHVTFCKAAIALHFVGTHSTLRAFQRRRENRTSTIAPSWMQMEARRMHCGSWEVKIPA